MRNLSGEKDIGSALHHRDVVGLALLRLKQDLAGERSGEVLASLHKLLRRQR